MSRFSDKEKQLFWNLNIHVVLSTMFSQLLDELVPAWCSFYWIVVRRLCYIISARMESILQSCVLHRWRWCQGPCPISRFGVWRVSGAFSDVLSHCGIGVCFLFWYRWDSWRQEDTIALKQFKVRVSWLKIVDKAAWNFKFQKSCFSLS